MDWLMSMQYGKPEESPINFDRRFRLEDSGRQEALSELAQRYLEHGQPSFSAIERKWVRQNPELFASLVSAVYFGD